MVEVEEAISTLSFIPPPSYNEREEIKVHYEGRGRENKYAHCLLPSPPFEMHIISLDSHPYIPI